MRVKIVTFSLFILFGLCVSYDFSDQKEKKSISLISIEREREMGRLEKNIVDFHDSEALCCLADKAMILFFYYLEKIYQIIDK